MNFIDRLKEEKRELNDRLFNLSVFISSERFNNISKQQKSLLTIQLASMQTYLTCLNERLIQIENP